MVSVGMKNGLRGLTEDEATEFVREALTYEEISGHFYWKIMRPIHHFSSERRMKYTNNRFGGKRAGYLNSRGYLTIRINGIDYRAHRLAYLYVNGLWPKDQIDHLNGVKDDNSWENLRDCSNSENRRNLRMQKNNTSGYTGVHLRKDNGYWVAMGREKKEDGKYRQIYLGRYKIFEDAVKARKAWELSEGNFTERHGK